MLLGLMQFPSLSVQNAMQHMAAFNAVKVEEMSKCGAFFSPFGNTTCDERVLSYSENSASSVNSITFSNNWIKDRASCFPIAKKACQ